MGLPIKINQKRPFSRIETYASDLFIIYQQSYIQSGNISLNCFKEQYNSKYRKNISKNIYKKAFGQYVSASEKQFSEYMDKIFKSFIQQIGLTGGIFLKKDKKIMSMHQTILLQLDQIIKIEQSFNISRYPLLNDSLIDYKRKLNFLEMDKTITPNDLKTRMIISIDDLSRKYAKNKNNFRPLTVTILKYFFPQFNISVEAIAKAQSKIKK